MPLPGVEPEPLGYQPSALPPELRGRFKIYSALSRGSFPLRRIQTKPASRVTQSVDWNKVHLVNFGAVHSEEVRLPHIRSSPTTAMVMRATGVKGDTAFRDPGRLALNPREHTVRVYD